MYGDKAFDLIRELDRTTSDIIPLYNADAVRQILEETQTLCDKNQEDANMTVSGDPSFFGAIHLRHGGMERNKQCLLAYIYNRLHRIRDLRWDFGSVLPADIMENLCDQEVQWLNNYNKSLATYMRGLGGGLDLTQDIKPPKSLCLEVRCVQDYGLLELEDGDVVMLKKDTQHLLPRSECLPLIRQGVLEHVP